MSGGYRWSPTGSRNPAYKGGLITDADWFQELYSVQKRSLREVAKQAGCGLRTAARWAKIHQIPVRSPAEAAEIPRTYRGTVHHKWKGGVCLGVQCACGKKIAYANQKRRAKGPPQCLTCARHASRGANNHAWKGQADIMVLVRQYVHHTWTPRVLQRDHYTCKICGYASGHTLVAHHIHRLAALVNTLLKGNSLVTAEDRLQAVTWVCTQAEINDIANGVTLCTPCHRRLHHGPRRDIVPLPSA